MLAIAHRGAMLYAPENTLASFAKALELGADMVEFDVRKTRDNVLVIIHDPKLKGRKISHTNFAELTSLKGDLVSLKKALEFLQGKTSLNIEIKEPGIGLEVAVEALKYFPQHKLVFSSSHKQVAGEIKSKFPGAAAGWIIGNRGWNFFSNFISWIFKGLPKETDLLVLNWMIFFLCPKSFLGKYKLFLFTANNSKLIKKFAQAPNVAGIITNRPEIFRST